MAFTPNEQFRYWGIGAVLLLVALWLLGGVLLPFVTGMAIAYLLDPWADKLEAAGLSRAASTSVITVGALMVIVTLLVVLIPMLARQTAALISEAPQYLSQLQMFLEDRFPRAFDAESPVRQGLSTVVRIIQERGGDVANALLASAFTIVDVVVFIVVAPVVAFYMLLDWDRMIATVDSWIPRDHLEEVRGLVSEINRVLSGFVRGQLSVCAVLGTFYAIGLMSVGLQFGLVVGLVAGMLTFIPYVGSIIGAVLSIGLALYQFWDTPLWIAVVAGIFAFGQFLEGNILTPRWVGHSVGLHPVWLMFALSGFGTLMGFTGMLIAVPVAACLGVFFRYGVTQYLGGRLYQGLSRHEDDAQDG